MTGTNRRMGLLAATVFSAGLIFAGSALGGPPLICFPYETGGAKSLPWGGKDPFDKAGSYGKKDLVKDTLSLLKTEQSTLARMETLRRAAIYAHADRQLATELLAKLAWIALDMEAAGESSADAWFNAGFLATCYGQLASDLDWIPGQAEGIKGYAWVRKAIELAPDNAEMHFAAALATHRRGKLFDDHMRKALAGAEAGTNLARNIEANHVFGNKSVAELRKSYGVADASGRGR